MAKDLDESREVIAPGAFDGVLLPAEVPLTDEPGGDRIGTAKVTKGDTGLMVSMTIPGTSGKQTITGHIPQG